MIFSNFHVIDNISKRLHKVSLKDFYIISVQHILSTTGSMFESIIKCGFSAKQIYLLGKIYSTNQDTKDKLLILGINIFESTLYDQLGEYTQNFENDVKKMWSEFIKNLNPNSKIIILDDGGFVLKNTPQEIIDKYKVFGIEQTTSGIRMQNVFGKFPVIHLASSATKVILEPRFVSEAMVLQIGNIIQDINLKRIGVVGYGHVGKAVVNDFRNSHEISVFDIRNEMGNKVYNNVKYCQNINELIHNVDVLIGATGQDISDVYWLNEIKQDIILISVSSGDIEFNRLIKNCKSNLINQISSPLDILKIRTENNSRITVLRGGMVANFTGAQNSSSTESIQLTRGLIISAIIQIIEKQDNLLKKNGAIMLSPSLQREVVKYWFNDQPQKKLDYPSQIVKGFQNINWIRNKSGGKYIV